MSGRSILYAIFKRFRSMMLVTFGLLSIENVLMVLTPLVLGWAIDDLIAGRLDAVFMLGGLFVAGTVIGTARRLYDTRCYGKIYATLATENSLQGWHEERSISSLNARSEQIREMVEFVETDLVMSFNAVVKILGACLLLSLVDYRLMIGVAVSITLVALIYTFSSKSIYRLNKGLNDQHDKQVQILESRKKVVARQHFSQITRWIIRLSDLEARNFALVDLVATALVLFSLWVAASAVGATAGSIFTILAYVLEIIEGSYLLPLAFQQFVRLSEIASRLTLTNASKEIAS